MLLVGRRMQAVILGWKHERTGWRQWCTQKGSTQGGGFCQWGLLTLSRSPSLENCICTLYELYSACWRINGVGQCAVVDSKVIIHRRSVILIKNSVKIRYCVHFIWLPTQDLTFLCRMMSKFVTRWIDEWTAHNLQYLQNGDKRSLEECTLLKIKWNEIFHMSAYRKQHKGKRQDKHLLPEWHS